MFIRTDENWLCLRILLDLYAASSWGWSGGAANRTSARHFSFDHGCQFTLEECPQFPDGAPHHDTA